MEEFEWTQFLERNGGKSVPEDLFSHVEASLNNGIKQRMLLEVCHKNNPDVYWIAQVTMVCGHLLRFKYLGSNNDFWCDVSKVKVHPLGWCGKYDEQIEPPDEINEQYGDCIIDIMKKALSHGQSVSLRALNNKGLLPIDRIKSGMKVEVQNILDPYKYWIATISENLGGRLLLKYDGAGEDLDQFWIFFCNPRLSSFGYVTNKGAPWQFKYPGKINKFSCKNKLSTQLRQSAEESIKEPTPADLFQTDKTIEAHSFVTGMKMEALDPQNMSTIRPATVTKVFNNIHFLVVIDDHNKDYEETKMAWLCDAKNPYIYPIGWAQKNGIALKAPKIWTEEAFDWDEYLSITSSVPAPDYCFGTKESLKGLEVNMKLEAVNPLKHDEIHVASIVCIVDHMVCVELLPVGEKFWFAQESDLLFPVGWCDSNNYPLHFPTVINQEFPKPKVEVAEDDVKNNEVWCDRIFFNYKCYAGPSISRNKLSQLPKHVGPGPLILVLKEVLNKIISASYKPAKLLKDLESKDLPKEGMKLELLRAKLKSNTYHGYVAISTKPEEVEFFCRDVCVKMQACPCLFGPVEYPEQCPNICQRVDKSTFHNSTERRGRPKGINGKRRRRKGKYEKKEKELQTSQETESNKDQQSAESEGSSQPHESRPNSPVIDCSKELKKRRNSKYPKLKMKTRGAKLPNFALQIKEAHWNKKDAETIYNSTFSVKKRTVPSCDSENSNDSSSRFGKNISDVSDSEEPELKKLKFATDDPLPTNTKMFERGTLSFLVKSKLKLSPNPFNWTIDDVYKYLSNTEDCKLIADIIKKEEIDGHALILLDLPIIVNLLRIKKEHALHLCNHITKIRWYYLVTFEGQC